MLDSRKALGSVSSKEEEEEEVIVEVGCLEVQ